MDMIFFFTKNYHSLLIVLVDTKCVLVLFLLFLRQLVSKYQSEISEKSCCGLFIYFLIYDTRPKQIDGPIGMYNRIA